jgi:hypothetical protein
MELSPNDEPFGRSPNFGYDAQLCTNEKIMARFMIIDSVYVNGY